MLNKALSIKVQQLVKLLNKHFASLINVFNLKYGLKSQSYERGVPECLICLNSHPIWPVASAFSSFPLLCFSSIALCNILVPFTLFLVKYLHYPVYYVALFGMHDSDWSIAAFSSQ